MQVIGENTYYVANDDGTISSFAPYQFDENAIKADEEIVQGYDGRYYFASQCPEKPARYLPDWDSHCALSLPPRRPPLPAPA